MSIASLVRTGPLLTASLLLSACTGIGLGVQPPNCPVEPVPTGELPDVELRAHMRFTIGSEEARFEAIARSTPQELRIVGISVYGIRLFAIHQRGVEFRIEGAPSRAFEHLALWTFDALHRSIWIETPMNAAAGPVVSWQRENERMTESVEAGERHREFSRSRTSARVRVHYTTTAAPAKHFEIRNPWCGYEAVIAIAGSGGEPSGE
ncbi:MAG: DUF3261 domain-containing protein [Deltaproteobacteria bacterium]|nr:DUF3261 domain-containing protein [Deltaproteobacteria bacterium]